MKPIERAVSLTGTNAEMARRLSALTGATVSDQRVWNWVNRDKTFPAEFCIPVERVTIDVIAELEARGVVVPDGPVTREQLRPDIFGSIPDEDPAA